MRNSKGMKSHAILFAVSLAQALWSPVQAHPASGIVVDAEGRIYFIQSRRGVSEINTNGECRYIYPTRGGHWMCLDEEGAFARTQPKGFARITPTGAKPAIIFADGGAPIAVNRDGNLYYGSGDDMSPGGLTVTRLSPDDKQSLFSPALKTELAKIDEGVTGLAAGPDGTLYVASPSAIFKVAMNGAVATLVHPVEVPGCADQAIPEQHQPYLRGLAVDTTNTVYVAASSCRCVLKVSPQGSVQRIISAESPWYPTGVAVFHGQVYALEYRFVAQADEPDQYPCRVRVLRNDGRLATLFDGSQARANAGATQR
jgi:hypothetical protein